MKRALAFGGVALVLGVVLGVYIARRGPAKDGDDIYQRHLEHCSLVRTALEIDVRDLETTRAPARQIEAADRFLEPKAFHSHTDVTLCSRALPPLLEVRTQCWLRNDFHCLAILARATEATVADYVTELRAR